MANAALGFAILGIGLVMLLWGSDRLYEHRHQKPSVKVIYLMYIVGIIYLIAGGLVAIFG